MLVTSSPSSDSANIVRESVRQRLCEEENWELGQRCWAARVGRQSELPLDRPVLRRMMDKGWVEGTGVFKIPVLPSFKREKNCENETIGNKKRKCPYHRVIGQFWGKS